MNFETVSELGGILYEDHCDPQSHAYTSKETIITVVLYGSQLYHPEYANDYDFMVFGGTEEVLRRFRDEGHTFRDRPMDIKNASPDDCAGIISMECLSALRDYPEWTNCTIGGTREMALVLEAYLQSTNIRSVISKKCSNSFVKAKKKLLVEKDYNKRASMKSLFHSIRMYDFACQYAKQGKIYDFQSCKSLYEGIRDDYTLDSDLDILGLIDTKYKPMFNQRASKFRLYYPKK